LDFWQSQTPEQRLSALVAIRRDVIKVEQARLQNKKTAGEVKKRRNRSMKSKKS